ncbi:hypothetical protein ACP4OV_002276 [Aristida adscensionis]
MALWNGLGQAATVAQLAGVDAAGLISKIIQAVQTVRRNREECRQLVHHVMMIGDLLQLLQQSEMMQRPELRRPLDGLEDTLRQAYVLVTSCQQSNILYRLFMAENQAQKFRDVRDRIDSYLRIYPLISHIDTRYFISELYSRDHPSGSGTQPQVSEELMEAFTSHTNPHSRTARSSSVDNGIKSVQVQAVTESSAVEEQQQNGYGNTKLLPNTRHRFRCLGHWALRETSTTQSIHGLTGHEQTGGFTIFKLSQLAACTNNFSSQNIIGRGGFGDVYKGVLPNGAHIAIKTKHRDSRWGKREFENEVQIIPKLQHANIIKLLGCCIEEDNMVVVYEYMPRGNLHYIIHELRAGISLAWTTRFQIIERIAQGISYLHQHSRVHVVHKDLKPSNILLDSDMTPRITDFGHAEVLSSDEDEKETALVSGTSSYVDPKYARTGIVSNMCDVYAFGIIVLEITTAQHAYTSPNWQLLVYYAWELWSSGRMKELVDASLLDEPRIDEIIQCVQIALLCVQENWVDRPTMSDVVTMLKCESMTLPAPRPPENARGQWSGPSAEDSQIETTGGVSHTTAEWMAEEIESSLLELECR